MINNHRADSLWNNNLLFHKLSARRQSDSDRFGPMKLRPRRAFCYANTVMEEVRADDAIDRPRDRARADADTEPVDDVITLTSNE